MDNMNNTFVQVLNNIQNKEKTEVQIKNSWES